jgi:mono/diheme cytochrome c family protein
MKHFRLGTRLIETRLLMHHPGGDWAGYTYAWDANETDANLVQGGRIDLINGQDWIFPSGAECDACHTAAAGFSLGLETAQLNNDLMYPATGRTANQLLSLNAVGVFANTIGDPAALQALVNPADPGALLTARARAYLHTNCAQCHRPGGPTPSDMDLRFTTLLDATLACDVVPQAGDLGLGTNARIIAPGDAALSVLIARMARRDANAMPPLGSSTMDAAGIQLVSNWINSLATCL